MGEGGKPKSVGTNVIFCRIFLENKKVLLRERKRHTARRVARARYADLLRVGWGTQSHARGVPSPRSRGVPSLRSGGYPIPGPGGVPQPMSRGGYPGLGWRVPHPRSRGGTPSQVWWGVPGTPPSSRPGWGTPPPQTLDGVPPPQV